MKKDRSLFDFSDEELLQVVSTGVLPDHTTLEGMENSANFDRLWKLRANPAKLAQAIMRERTNVSSGALEPMEMKKHRLELKKQELELKQVRTQGQTQLFTRVMEKLRDIETKLDMLIKARAKGD